MTLTPISILIERHGRHIEVEVSNAVRNIGYNDMAAYPLTQNEQDEVRERFNEKEAILSESCAPDVEHEQPAASRREADQAANAYAGYRNSLRP